ncbi:MAG: prepilin-type N-terminal cleavage/methylation domain-containing protein [Nitrospirae bacterium]|nr:prepilin-type N-terminal cleavage/methylation domain-containing protein [Magnetococcales bacterium]HAT48750.1 hypothetical protein [Alphaproteobacteria bacterium]
MDHKQTGFSLIEVAIAMVIMGLLVGSGILLGRSLIGSGHSQEIVAMATDLNIAVKNFKERYHYFPGDLPDAKDDITGMDLSCHYNNKNSATVQIGNGEIDTSSLTITIIDSDHHQVIYHGSEATCVPNHLYKAGLIQRIPDKDGDIVSRFGKVRIMATAQSSFKDVALDGHPDHIIQLENLPVEIARDVDRYLDNGDITTGRMQGINATAPLAIDPDPNNQPETVRFYAVPL